MFQPYELFVGLRYTRAKRRNHFISFISLISMLGIALGVTALITVISVMNGFEKEFVSNHAAKRGGLISVCLKAAAKRQATIVFSFQTQQAEHRQSKLQLEVILC